MRGSLLAAALFALTLAGCASTGTQMTAASGSEKHPEARLYDASRNAAADVDAALSRARSSGNHILIVLGANWCHDSRAFAGWTETPRFKELLGYHYETVFVNVGMPQTGDGHNIEIARRFGIDEIVGTPTVLILSPSGSLLNGETAGSWRNAASRTEQSIYEELAGYIQHDPEVVAE
ncbi:thioredoxin family protein [Altererythrobacter luteolus]|uniref:Thioredoxin family protein n=1 Tax=Pontixanthobacter luteolus TaxID=295089 RepID=A0A6I4V5F9_9SPHN|nr:thioredoxin family protein [Pontixanthobacter luteolus]MXP47514.1 thioredoxin family protein [Pontixanthobacter luteolus]